jgi:ABC-2 type transport system permease protein
MQPNSNPSNAQTTKRSAMPLIRRIANKEITLFFASPIAYLFLATFAAISLFIFFWGESYFSRNIADIRPLFEWMPVLLVFLTSTLTMRLWSEERRTGTLEHILTQPLPLWHFVVGKFLGCLVLLAIALLITIPLPITVAQMGDIDWGPIWAGYLAAFLLGAAYLSIGLFVSARSDNQIVSLICAVGLSGLFYLVGTTTITDFFGNQAGEWFRLFGTGARFDSITRGVIDIRDLYYYISIIIVFLSLNIFTLERERWAEHTSTPRRSKPRHKAWKAVTALAIINVIGVNLWLGQVTSLRLDTTEGKQYSISDATREYLSQIQEPMLIRGYFSSKTHPLLAPLVPQIKDLIREYEIASRGKVRVDFIDPVVKLELEEEANQRYGIRPIPLQVADRYQSAIVNSYFHILISYGNEFEILDFQDLIETKAQGDHDFQIKLRNPEYDLTRSIKKVLNSYRSGGNLFDTVKGDLTFNAYISQDALLSEDLIAHKKEIVEVANEIAEDSEGRLKINIIDPYAGNSSVAKKLSKEYGLSPLSTSRYGGDFFYFHLILEREDMAIQIPLEDKTKLSFERNLKAGIKRFGKGFIKTIGFVSPVDDPKLQQIGISVPQFNQLAEFLGTDLNIIDEDLSDGSVSGEVDILVVAAPNGMGSKEVFAIDQFVMKGGSVVAMASPYTMTLGRDGLGLAQLEGEFKDWLRYQGLDMEHKLVLDMQNKAFPLPVMRNAGGHRVQEVRMIEYPYFSDIRSNGFNQENAITANLSQVTMAWSSPIAVDTDKNSGRKVTELIRSSENSWISDNTEIMPEINEDGMTLFQREGEFSSHLLGVVSEGVFNSYFAGKPSPLLSDEDEKKGSEAKGRLTTEEIVAEINGTKVSDSSSNSISNPDTSSADNQVKEEPETETVETIDSSVIQKSPASSRIVLFSSNDFLRDQTLTIANSAVGSEYLGSLELVANAVDWTLEESGLLSIRSRGHFNRTLPPMEHDTQLFWEYLNYGLVAIALIIIALVRRKRQKSRQQRYLAQLAN